MTRSRWQMKYGVLVVWQLYDGDGFFNDHAVFATVSTNARLF